MTKSNAWFIKSFSFWWLVFVGILSIFASLLSNPKPWVVKYMDGQNDKSHYILDATNYRNDYLNNRQLFRYIFFAPVPYTAGQTDADNLGLKSPFEENFYSTTQGSKSNLPVRFKHFLGTDQLGCDVLAGIIHGARYSMAISLGGMLIATLIALFAGIASGYFFQKGIMIGRIHLFFLLTGLFLAWFYSFFSFRFVLSDSFQISVFQSAKSVVLCSLVFVFIVFVFHRIGKYLSCKLTSKKISLPADAIISRITETFTAIPSFILLLSIIAFAKPSITTTIFIFGVTAWTDISRIVRAQVLKLKANTYVEAAITSGLSHRQIIVRHILPNLFPVITPVVLYGIAVIILSESGLSFLGLGVEPGTVTWGNLLAQGKDNMDAWWLIVFPGLFIFLTVNSLYRFAKKFE